MVSQKLQKLKELQLVISQNSERQDSSSRLRKSTSRRNVRMSESEQSKLKLVPVRRESTKLQVETPERQWCLESQNRMCFSELSQLQI